jgi:hypothetical protein
MVILLTGSSQLSRSAIANRFVKEDKQWRHLPLEELDKLQPLQDIEGRERDDVLLRIACQCALELMEQGFHLIISCEYMPAAGAIARDELKDDVLLVHIGGSNEIEDSDYPFRIDASRATVGEVYQYLQDLISKAS